jgi:FkbM family methyltransferase
MISNFSRRMRRVTGTLSLPETARFFSHTVMRKKLARLHPVRCEKPLWYRPGTSDWATIWETFGELENDAPFPITPSVIVDCGANGGFTGRYFQQRWPSARLVLVEPDSGNLAVLRRNVEEGPGARVVPAAIWGRDERIGFDNGERGNAFQVSSAGRRMVDGRTLDSILSEQGLKEVDLLKVDIEGGERALFFEGPTGFLARTKMVLIEFHGRDLENSISSALRTAGFKRLHEGRKHLFVRESLI